MINNVGLTASEKKKAQEFRAAGMDAHGAAKALRCTVKLTTAYFAFLDKQAGVGSGGRARKGRQSSAKAETVPPTAA